MLYLLAGLVALVVLVSLPRLVRSQPKSARTRVLTPEETAADAAPPGTVSGYDDPGRWNKLVQQLRELGFFEHLPPDQIEQSMRQCVEMHWLFEGEEERSFFADAEDLAEGGIGRWLQQSVAPRLEHKKIPMPAIEESYSEDAYTVQIGPRKYTVHTEQDDDLTKWKNGCVHAIRIVNDLLTDANHPERLFWLHGAEDGLVAFLTPAMFERITLARVIPSGSWPYAQT